MSASAVKTAIAAGKDVYCEWPLTTNTQDSEELLSLAQAAEVRHVVGLHRTLEASAQYLRDLLADGYVGRLRSVRMHVSMEYFGPTRSPALEWTLDSRNFSHVLSIYGGHFMDMLFYAVGRPQTVSAIVATQFPELTLSATAESFPNETPDAVMAIGTLEGGGLFEIQIEGGKQNHSGLQIDITGTSGDLKIWNERSFGTKHDNILEGAQGEGSLWAELPLPDRYQRIPPSSFDVSVQDLAQLYTAFARDCTHWANAAAFTNAPVATGPTDLFAFGGQAAQANGPNFHRGDVGIQKQWHIPWSGIIEFRAEAFNLTNTPNFGQPGSLSPTASNFTSITNTRNTPNDSRQLQFAVKYLFGHNL